MKLIVVIGLVAVVGYLGFVEYVQRCVRCQLEVKLNDWLPENVKAKIGKANFIEGVGFKIDHLSLRSKASEKLLNIESAFIHMPISTPELVAGKTEPTAVKVTQATIQLELLRNGTWNFEPLLKCFQGKAPMDKPLIPIDFVDCQLKIINRQDKRKLDINQINLSLREQESGEKKLVRLVGSLTGNSVDSVQFQAFFDPSLKSWNIQVKTKQARLSKELFRLLPESLRDGVVSTEVLGGTLDVEANLRGDLSGSMPQMAIKGQLSDFALKHPDLPLTISRTNLDFQISDSGISVSNATGNMGSGSFNVSYQQSGLLEQKNWSLAGSLNHFDFQPKLVPLFPLSFQNFCRDFSPAGTSDIKFQLVHDGQQLNQKVFAEIKDLSFSFIKVPYLMEHCRGTVRWINDQLNFRLTTNDRGQEIVMAGAVHRPGKHATFKIDIDLSGSLPIDEKLLRSIRKMPKLQTAVHAFRPSGRIHGKATITKSQPNQKPQQEIQVRLVQCNIRHTAFDYPIYNVNGWVRYRRGTTYFQQITGDSGVAKIEANGTFSEEQGINVNFLCNQIPLNEQLRVAIPSNIRDIWNGFRPNGVVSILRVNLTKPPQRGVAITVDADLGNKQTANNQVVSNVSIYPKWFPYTIQNLTGNIFVGNGEIRLTKMRGKHDRTLMIWNGSGTYSPESWSLLLQKMYVGAVKVNEELLAALPKSLAPAIRQLQYQGALSVAGDIHLDGRVIKNKDPNIGLVSFDSFYDVNDPSSSASMAPKPIANQRENKEQFWNTSLAWDLRFDMDQAKMMLGLPVQNVFGKVGLQGRYDGRKAVCRGQLSIDSLTLYDAQITEVSGPIWIDENQLLAGNYVQTEQSDRPQTPLAGKLFGGVIRLDAKKNFDKTGNFFVQASLAQGDLKDAVKEFAPQLEQVAGTCFTAIRFQGNNAGPRSYSGKGTLQLRNAEIYQLPIMIALLKIPHFKNLNRTAFDSSNIDFNIASDRFVLDRIELIGDAISLIGNGQVTFTRELDLNFYTVMGRGRFYIPIISELYRAGSKRVLWINVDGPMQSPNASREILPQLNDTIKKLFESRSDPKRSELNTDMNINF